MKIIVYTAQWCKNCTTLKNEVYSKLQVDTAHTWEYIDVDNMDDDNETPNTVPYVKVIKDKQIIELKGYYEINQTLELLFD